MKFDSCSHLDVALEVYSPIVFPPPTPSEFFLLGLASVGLKTFRSCQGQEAELYLEP